MKVLYHDNIKMTDDTCRTQIHLDNIKGESKIVSKSYATIILMRETVRNDNINARDGTQR